MRAVAILLGYLVASAVFAADWQFQKPLVVTAASRGVFCHLDASGRKSLAVSDDTVAIVWEDNRSGSAQIYAAFKKIDADGFTPPLRISDAGPAYEPAVAALPHGRFVAGWEANGRVWSRLISPTEKGPVTALSSHPAQQLTLARAATEGKVVAAWAQRRDKWFQIMTAGLTVQNGVVVPRAARLVDDEPPRDHQFYPAIAESRAGVVVAWEDRRQGATRIMTAFAPPAGGFGPPRVLNDFRASRIARFGNGTGAMRVVLATDGQANVTAAWLDKRDFEGGYDVYAAVSEDGGKTFAADEIVQDMLGENTPQWHAAVAMSRQGNIVVAWDDSREGSKDVWFSTREESWSDDNTFPAMEDGRSEAHPVLAYDDHGRLHAAWLELRQGASVIRYVQGMQRFTPP